uniref:Uncharacterized protein n=1 Tax=Arundo donax TaxID=35708 RepID=A0A0A9DJB3_ARUDO
MGEPILYIDKCYKHTCYDMANVVTSLHAHMRQRIC